MAPEEQTAALEAVPFLCLLTFETGEAAHVPAWAHRQPRRSDALDTPPRDVARGGRSGRAKAVHGG